MIKIGIICGSGNLPLAIGKNLLEKKYNVFFFCIKNFTEKNKYKDFNFIEIGITSFTSIVNLLKKEKIEKIIMAGKISRPSIKDIKFDLNTIALIKNYFLESKGDDQLLKSVSNFFLKKGFPLFNWRDICKELFLLDKFATIKKPSDQANRNKTKGLEIFSTIGKSDIGQSMIIQNQLILGIECIEGTDSLIERCSNYKKKGDKGILIKLSKYNQHTELDLPTIGIETVKNIKNFGYEGLFIEKNNCVIIERDRVIDYCNTNNLFLSTLEKLDQ